MSGGPTSVTSCLDSGPNSYDGKLYNSSRNGSNSNWVEGVINSASGGGDGDGIGSAIVTEDGIIYDGSSDNFLSLIHI